MKMRLISLNVEYSKHIALTLPFFERERADVVCVQEMREVDMPLFAAATGSVDSVFSPMTAQVHEGRRDVVGLALFSRHPFAEVRTRYYAGDGTVLPQADTSDPRTYNNKISPVLFADIRTDGAVYRICTTHFTWTPDGLADELQREHVEGLLRVLADNGDFVLAGDFNAPRGGEIFGRIARTYTDNIPARYVTSLDTNLHRAGKTRPEQLADKMVDGLFSTPGYTVSEVSLVGGVSDHLAIVAEIGTTKTP